MGKTNGPPFSTISCPQSGCTIYQVNLQTDNAAESDTVDQHKASVLSGSGTEDIMFGGQGNDTMHGGAGDDFIQGDDGLHVSGSAAATGGDDIIFGGDGNDSIEGGPGNDIMFGGAGNDDLDELRGTTASTKLDNNLNPLPPLFPTIANYGARFPLPSGQTYDSDPGGQDSGGTVTLTKQIGDFMYGGYDRNVMQSQANGFGDRMIDETGNYNLDLLCPAYYGQYQILRIQSPYLHSYLDAVANAGLANSGTNNTAIDATNPASSGGVELSEVQNGTNHGPAYSGTPGHFTC